LHFTRLPGTRAEAQYLEQLLGVRAFTDRWAVEALLKRHPSPRILHIATHGVFLPNQPMSADLGPARSWASCENPLLRSALALAAANLTGTRGVLPEEAGDGILTALEVAGLDLLGTELVVLSACETGLGQYAVGEGVYGLRRAFMLAGARSLVISLWKVSDLATALLMRHFYDGLVVRRMARDAALAEAKRWLRTLPAAQLAALIREPSFAGLAADAQRFLHNVQPPFDHPRYWAAFVLIGDPGPL
jgi:CHAT domain-containing protein